MSTIDDMKELILYRIMVTHLTKSVSHLGDITAGYEDRNICNSLCKVLEWNDANVFKITIKKIVNFF